MSADVGWVPPGVAWLKQTGAADYAAATGDLEATHEQAVVLLWFAFAWRITAVLLPLAVVAGAVSVVAGGPLLQSAIWPGLAVLAPQLVAAGITFPMAFAGSIQSFYRGSHDARIRFGTTGLVYPYYGWRFAYRGRKRPWGALTSEEKRAVNPRRFGTSESASLHAPTRPPGYQSRILVRCGLSSAHRSSSGANRGGTYPRGVEDGDAAVAAPSCGVPERVGDAHRRGMRASIAVRSACPTGVRGPVSRTTREQPPSSTAAAVRPFLPCATSTPLCGLVQPPRLPGNVKASNTVLVCAVVNRRPDTKEISVGSPGLVS